MIPYFIQQASPDEDTRFANIYTQFDSCEMQKLHETFIRYITNIMYEFCSENYGHGVKIRSYDDFCYQYWKIHENEMKGWYSIFRVYYFFENDWIEWNIENYKDTIYSSYLSRFQHISHK